MYGYDPLVLAGRGSFADSILSLLNAENIVKLPKDYSVYSVEQILVDAPDVILDGVAADHGAPVTGFDWSKFKSIPAVRTQRVYQLRAMSVLRAGPRILEATRLVSRLLSKKP